MTDTEIRLNWFNALKRKNEWDSSTIEWGFSDQDLLVLMNIHKAGFFRSEIEDLLEDCNFHTECELMSKMKYNECETIIINEMIGE